MRTKVLLCLAVFAAGLATSVAQNVYSANVVGYVNVTLQAKKLHFLSLPLAPTDGNYNITNTITLSDPQEGAVIFDWIGAQWDTKLPTWYGGGAGWFNVDNTDTIISNGTAFFLSSVANSVLTFVGEVPQGTAIPYNIPAGLTTLANKVPVSTNFPGIDIGHENDVMFTWVQSAQSWDNNYWQNYGVGTGWYTGVGGDGTGPLLNPAEGVFYVNTGAAIPFTRSFTVQ